METVKGISAPNDGSQSCTSLRATQPSSAHNPTSIPGTYPTALSLTCFFLESEVADGSGVSDEIGESGRGMPTMSSSGLLLSAASPNILTCTSSPWGLFGVLLELTDSESDRACVLIIIAGETVFSWAAPGIDRRGGRRKFLRLGPLPDAARDLGTGCCRGKSSLFSSSKSMKWPGCGLGLLSSGPSAASL